MQIKRFEAKTMTAALRMVKEEFGPEAVILSARTLRQGRGFFGAGRVSGVEVTAAKDSGWPAYTAAGLPATQRVQVEAPAGLPETSGRHGLFHSLNESLRSLAGRRSAPAAGAARVGQPPELAELHQHFLSQEVQPDLAAELVDHIKRLPGYDPLIGVRHLRPQAGTLLQDMGLRMAIDSPEAGTPRVVALVGPSGVGKTTTVIKLAVREALQKGRRVALMTLDDRRIGAIEELRIYAEILDVPLAEASCAVEARQALQDLATLDVIIIDTPGVSPGEDERRGEVRQTLQALKCKEIFLVLSACCRERDLRQVIEAWKQVPVSGLAFTRLDETGACGSILNLLIRSRLPLFHLSTGPQIPEDLAERPVELLISRLWPNANAPGVDRMPGVGMSGTPGPAAARTPVQFVANRNSDLYHRTDCKWARKIKREHLVQFTSAAEAESRNFLACRNCSPDLSEPAEDDGAPRNGARIAGYR
ncbi:MAG: Ada metal-binding domain-containing protein [Hyphomicrobiales bacterium]